MATPGVKIMTSDDIFFEVNGQRVAGVESYTTKYTNDVKLVDAFGQNTPIGYTLGINFYNLSDFDFNFVVIKNGKRTTYKYCVISDISEDGTLKDKVAEKITLMALDRIEE